MVPWGYHLSVGVLLATALFSGPLSAAVGSETPQRIVSLNLCTDQLLLLLVERERIASVTYWAVNEDSSYLADQAKGLPVNHGLVEEVVPLKPDLVVSGRFTDPMMTGHLEHLGYPVQVVDVPETLQGAGEHIRQFGQLVGEEERARQLVQSMQDRLAKIAAKQDDGPEPLAIVYAANGITAGAGTLMNEVIEAAGFRNLAAELGIGGYGTVALEQIIAAKPQLLILDAHERGNGDSIAHSYLQHPALKKLSGEVQQVTLPPKLTVCVGPMVVEAVERLAEFR